MSDHELLIERLGWTPDQIIIKRRGEVGAEIPGWTASGMTAETETYYPGQPRDRRGRWTKGMGGYVGPAATQAWADHITIHGGTPKMKEEIREALLKAAGKTSRIPLDSVRTIDQTAAYKRYGWEAGSIVGGYESPKTFGTYEWDENTIVLTPAGLDHHFVDEAHKAGVFGLSSGRNWEVPTPGETDGLTVTLAHEVGHAAYFGLDDDQKFDVENLIAHEAGIDWLDLELGTKSEEVARVLSVYATSNRSEAVAEAWCEYTLSNRPRPTAVAVGSYMEEVFK